MDHLSNDHEDYPNQHKNSYKVCHETGHSVVNLMESHWKLRQQRDQNFLMERKTLQNKYQHQKKEINPKKQEQENHSLGSAQESYHLSKVIWNRKIITGFTRSMSSTRIGKPVLMMDVKISKDKNISRWVDQENLIYVR